MDALINIRPFRDEDREQLVANAAVDQHAVYWPQFVYEKDGKIVGYCSMVVPMVLSWQDSQKMGPIDSVQVIKFIEGAMAMQPMVCIPCDPESPYMKFLPKAGYSSYFKPVNLFIKQRN